jgi:hypothetical protein
MTVIPTEELNKAAEKGESMWAALIRELTEDAKTWPKCRTCGQHTPPANLEEKLK